MDHANDVMARPEAPVGTNLPAATRPQQSDAVFQEINERRARVENPELLRHLRGL